MKRSDRLSTLESWAERVGPAELTETDLAGLQTIHELAQQRDRIEDELLAEVRRARLSGRSWSQIGAMLGVTKQAAQRKYGPMV